MIPIARPKTFELSRRFIKFDNLVIEVLSNCIEYLYYVLPKEVIMMEVENEEETSFVFAFYYTSLIGNEFTVYRAPTPEELKESYQPNSKFITNDCEFEENEFPNKTLHFKYGEKMFVVLSGNKDVFTFYIKRYIKKMVSIYYKKENYFILHAGGIVYKNDLYAIIGKSHSGKSTFCFNLCGNKFKLMNDDILFLKCDDDNIIVKSIPMNPCIRAKASPYIIDWHSRIKYDRDYYSEYNETYYVQDFAIESQTKKLKGLFFVDKHLSEQQKQYIESIVFPDDDEIFSTMAQFDKQLLEEDNKILEKIKMLPAYSIKLGENVLEVVEAFKRICD